MSRRLSKTFLPILIAIVGTVIVLYPCNPSNLTLPSRDSGVFFYVGWRFLNGDIPYRDVWDHKPPLIYFVDALGIALTPNSLWGTWLIQFILIFFTIYFLYKVLDQELGVYVALAGTIVLTSGLLTVLEKGNVTEEYALVFQTAGFWLFTRAWKRKFPLQSSFWIGVLGGLAFNFKQTTIGLWITYGIFLLVFRITQRKFMLKDFLALLAGWLIPSVVLVLYFGSQNALMDFWNQAYAYNFLYIGKHDGYARLFPVFIKGFAYLTRGWVLYLALAGWFAALVFVWFKRRNFLREVPPLLLIALLNFPIEVALLTVSGRSILHYYLTVLPVMAILSGTLTYTIPFFMARIPSISSAGFQKWVPGFILILILLAQYGQVKNYSTYVSILSQNSRAPVIAYIKQNTRPGDQILIIGAESVVNFLTHREAPTRYVYQYPLALTGSRPMFEEYFGQILKNKPLLIIDTRGLPHLEEKLYLPLQKRSQVVREGVRYLADNYHQVAQFGDWYVYRLAEK